MTLPYQAASSRRGFQKEKTQVQSGGVCGSVDGGLGEPPALDSATPTPMPCARHTLPGTPCPLRVGSTASGNVISPGTSLPPRPTRANRARTPVMRRVTVSGCSMETGKMETSLRTREVFSLRSARPATAPCTPPPHAPHSELLRPRVTSPQLQLQQPKVAGAQHTLSWR